MPTYRNALTRILAKIDQLLAEAEEIARKTDSESVRDAAINFVLEYQERRRLFEEKLKDAAK